MCCEQLFQTDLAGLRTVRLGPARRTRTATVCSSGSRTQQRARATAIVWTEGAAPRLASGSHGGWSDLPHPRRTRSGLTNRVRLGRRTVTRGGNNGHGPGRASAIYRASTVIAADRRRGWSRSPIVSSSFVSALRESSSPHRAHRLRPPVVSSMATLRPFRSKSIIAVGPPLRLTPRRCSRTLPGVGPVREAANRRISRRAWTSLVTRARGT